MKLSLIFICLAAPLFSGCASSSKLTPGKLEELGAYSVGQTYKVLAPVWVFRTQEAELSHGGLSVLPHEKGTLSKMFSPVLLPGDIVVKIEKIKVRFTPTAGGFTAEPTAIILDGQLSGSRVWMSSDGSWSVRETDLVNHITYFKPKPGKVIRL